MKLFLFLICLGWNLSILTQAEKLSIIYIIHGDGNYLFHDIEGNPLNAAERILSQAIFVSENIKNGEVFIFNQKPHENFLIFFPKDNGEFYYYKNGMRILEESYSRKDVASYEAEAELIKKFSRSSHRDSKNILLYYGHEIPEKEKTGYNSSLPERKFGINIFTEGVRQLINSLSPVEMKFDLLVLSTCRNGSYRAVKQLSPFTNYLIASPEDIHLSYLSSESLIKIGEVDFLDVNKFAKDFAEFAFNEMSKITSTEISVSVYDINKIVETNGSNPNVGVTNFYRPGKFGANRNSF